MSLGAIISIFISCIGLFGLSVLSAQRRTKEISVRKVLGASIPRIMGILSVDFMKLVFIAVLIALPIAWLAAHRWLQNYPYRVALSWWIFVDSAILVSAIALITVSFQTVKAASANPAKNLRGE
jgi:putative ABC transport system permease protein